MYTVIHIRTN